MKQADVLSTTTFATRLGHLITNTLGRNVARRAIMNLNGARSRGRVIFIVTRPLGAAGDVPTRTSVVDPGRRPPSTRGPWGRRGRDGPLSTMTLPTPHISGVTRLDDAGLRRPPSRRVGAARRTRAVRSCYCR